MVEVKESFKRELAEKEKLLASLQAERDKVKNRVTSSKKYKNLQACRKRLDEEVVILMKRCEKIDSNVRQRFLCDDGSRPYYDRSSSWSKTNIDQPVLSAISTVSPLSKLTGSLIEDTVKRMMELALHKHKTYSTYSKTEEKKREESHGIWCRLMRLAGEMGSNTAPDERISSLRTEVRKMREIIEHPALYKRRLDIDNARDKVRMGIKEIYAKFEELESSDDIPDDGKDDD